MKNKNLEFDWSIIDNLRNAKTPEEIERCYKIADEAINKWKQEADKVRELIEKKLKERENNH